MSSVADPLDHFVDTSKELGTLPGAYMRVSKVLGDLSATREDISAAVSLDPGLVARLLRLVNAPGFSRRPIQTVSHACTFLGRSQLRDLALATSVVHMFRGLPEHLLDMRSFWKHSVAVGLLAESLGKEVGRRAEESLFVAGLLHDVGTLAMCLHAPREMRNTLIQAENSAAALSDAQRDVMGFDHAQAGARLLEKWNLPPLHPAVARHHHNVPQDLTAPYKLAISLCHVADVVAIGLQMGSAGERRALDLDNDAWRITGLSIPQLERAVVDVEERLEEVVTALV